VSITNVVVGLKDCSGTVILVPEPRLRLIEADHAGPDSTTDIHTHVRAAHQEHILICCLPCTRVSLDVQRRHERSQYSYSPGEVKPRMRGGL